MLYFKGLLLMLGWGFLYPGVKTVSNFKVLSYISLIFSMNKAEKQLIKAPQNALSV